MKELEHIRKNAGLTENHYPGRDPNVSMPRETMDRILEALEGSIYAIEHPDSDQKFAVDAAHSALKLIDPHHTYKE